MWGCPLPDGVEADIYFGFRAIHQPGRQEFMELVHDRKTLTGGPTEDQKAAMANVLKQLREQSKHRMGDDHRKVLIEEDTPYGRICAIGYSSYGYFHGAIYILKEGA